MFATLSSHCPVCPYAGGRTPVVTQSSPFAAHWVSGTDPVSTEPVSPVSTWLAFGWMVAPIRCSPLLKQNVVPAGAPATTLAASSSGVIRTPEHAGVAGGVVGSGEVGGAV